MLTVAKDFAEKKRLVHFARLVLVSERRKIGGQAHGPVATLTSSNFFSALWKSDAGQERTSIYFPVHPK